MSDIENSELPIVVYVAGGGSSRATKSAYASLIVGSVALIGLIPGVIGNEGVYLALIDAVRMLPRGTRVVMSMDTELVIRQCVGATEVRGPKIRLLRRRFWILAIQREIEIEFRWTARAKNKAINLLRIASVVEQSCPAMMGEFE